MRRVLFLGSLTLWFCSCSNIDHGSGIGPGKDTIVDEITSTPNNPVGNAATNMGGDTGTVKGTGTNGSGTTVRSGAMNNSGGSTGGNSMNSSGTTSTNKGDSATNHSNQSGGNSGSGTSGTQHQ